MNPAIQLPSISRSFLEVFSKKSRRVTSVGDDNNDSISFNKEVLRKLSSSLPHSCEYQPFKRKTPKPQCLVNKTSVAAKNHPLSRCWFTDVTLSDYREFGGPCVCTCVKAVLSAGFLSKLTLKPLNGTQPKYIWFDLGAGPQRFIRPKSPS